MKQAKIQVFIWAFLLAVIFPAIAQSDAPPNSRAGTFSFYWGYNRSYYSTSNIHFRGPNYDFTVYDVKATDRPSKLSWEYIHPEKITIPQYVFRLSYFLTDRLHISGGLDHMKYVMTPNQRVEMSGVINAQASSKYQGAYLNQEVELSPDFLQFEHSDGFNLMTAEIEYLLPIKRAWKDRLSFSWNAGVGGIWMVTKTRVKIMGEGLDNDFHIAGYTAVVKTGPRLDLWDRVFVCFEVKTGYATLPSVLIRNASPEIGDHNVGFLEYYGAVGYYFRLWNRRSGKDKASKPNDS